MIQRKFTVAGLLLSGAIVTGCASSPGKRLVTYDTNTTVLPKPATADQTGIYGLYPDDGINPLGTIELQKGDPLGFRRLPDGAIVGFADGKEYPLTAVLATDYSWKYLGKEGEKK